MDRGRRTQLHQAKETNPDRLEPHTTRDSMPPEQVNGDTKSALQHGFEVRRSGSSHWDDEHDSERAKEDEVRVDFVCRHVKTGPPEEQDRLRTIVSCHIGHAMFPHRYAADNGVAYHEKDW